MNKTKIEWTRGPRGEPGYTWNPIKGLCPEGCSYCYARAMYRRFKLDERLEFHVTRGEIAKMDRLAPSKIFICSTMEMFHPNIKGLWRDRIFQTIEMFPKHTFIILTKRPERIDRPMPANVWLGVSVTGPGDMWRIEKMFEALAAVRFISFEPLLGPCGSFTNHLEGIKREMLQWVIVGRLTGHGHHNDPRPEWIEDVVGSCIFWRIPLFMKDNLAGIWPGSLIQYYPQKGVRP